MQLLTNNIIHGTACFEMGGGVQYYFSDRNYPRDKFMQETAKKDDEQWIPLPTIMTFNKLVIF